MFNFMKKDVVGSYAKYCESKELAKKEAEERNLAVAKKLAEQARRDAEPCMSKTELLAKYFQLRDEIAYTAYDHKSGKYAVSEHVERELALVNVIIALLENSPKEKFSRRDEKMMNCIKSESFRISWLFKVFGEIPNVSFLKVGTTITRLCVETERGTVHVKVA